MYIVAHVPVNVLNTYTIGCSYVHFVFLLRVLRAVRHVTVVSNFKQNGRTSLMSAVSKGHVDCARLLIEGGADKEAKDNVRDFTFHFLCLRYLFAKSLTLINIFVSCRGQCGKFLCQYCQAAYRTILW